MAQDQISKPKNVSTALRNKFAMFASGKKPRTLAKDNAGVSAVIGVILMVAVTVILAAVIGAFIFGMYPNILPTQNSNPISFKQDNTAKVITVINNGGISADNINVKVNGYKLLDVVHATDTTPSAADDIAAAAPLNTVGGMIKIHMDETGKLVTPGMLITVSGEINGNRVVIATYTVTGTVSPTA